MLCCFEVLLVSLMAMVFSGSFAQVFLDPINPIKFAPVGIVDTKRGYLAFQIWLCYPLGRYLTDDEIKNINIDAIGSESNVSKSTADAIVSWDKLLRGLLERIKDNQKRIGARNALISRVCVEPSCEWNPNLTYKDYKEIASL